MTVGLKQLVKLRRFNSGDNVDKYLNTQMRQNLESIEKSLTPRSGRYSSTTSEVTGIASIAPASDFSFVDNGVMIQVFGSFIITPSAANTFAGFQFTLPDFAGVFQSQYDVVGLCGSYLDQRSGIIISVAGTNLARMAFTSGASTTIAQQSFSLSFLKP